MARIPVASRRLGSEAARRALSFRMFGEVVSELRRVTWPSRQETMRLTLMVIAVSGAVGLFLGGIDIGFARFFGTILGN